MGDGTYTFDINSITTETVVYAATANGVIITQTADMMFMETEAQCLSATGGYETIVINSRSWLDRNPGASEVMLRLMTLLHMVVSISGDVLPRDIKRELQILRYIR